MVVWCTQKRVEVAAVSSGTSNVRTKQRSNYTTSVNIQSALQLKRYNHSFKVTCDKSAVSVREQRTALYKSDQQQQQHAGEPVWPSGKAGKQRDLGSNHALALLSLQKLWSVDTVTINKTLKWLASLSILMQESFWW